MLKEIAKICDSKSELRNTLNVILFSSVGLQLVCLCMFSYGDFNCYGLVLKIQYCQRHCVGYMPYLVSHC